MKLPIEIIIQRCEGQYRKLANGDAVKPCKGEWWLKPAGAKKGKKISPAEGVKLFSQSQAEQDAFFAKVRQDEGYYSWAKHP